MDETAKKAADAMSNSDGGATKVTGIAPKTKYAFVLNSRGKGVLALAVSLVAMAYANKKFSDAMRETIAEAIEEGS